MKQYNKKDLSDEIVLMKDMLPGQIGITLNGCSVFESYVGHVVMRSLSSTINRVYDLTLLKEDGCWSDTKYNTIKVQLLKTGSVVKLITN